MCFSAMVRQDLQWLAKRYGAEIAWEMLGLLHDPVTHTFPL